MKRGRRSLLAIAGRSQDIVWKGCWGYVGWCEQKARVSGSYLTTRMTSGPPDPLLYLPTG